MRITLSPELQAFVDEQVAQGRFASASAFIESVVARERERLQVTELEAELLERLSQPSVPMTEQDWEWIRREGRRYLESRRAG